jgi:hypothetical protein
LIEATGWLEKRKVLLHQPIVVSLLTHIMYRGNAEYNDAYRDWEADA